jgi:hypothetical protein
VVVADAYFEGEEVAELTVAPCELHVLKKASERKIRDLTISYTGAQKRQDYSEDKPVVPSAQRIPPRKRDEYEQRRYVDAIDLAV